MPSIWAIDLLDSPFLYNCSNCLILLIDVGFPTILFDLHIVIICKSKNQKLLTRGSICSGLFSPIFGGGSICSGLFFRRVNMVRINISLSIQISRYFDQFRPLFLVFTYLGQYPPDCPCFFAMPSSYSPSFAFRIYWVSLVRNIQLAI